VNDVLAVSRESAEAVCLTPGDGFERMRPAPQTVVKISPSRYSITRYGSPDLLAEIDDRQVRGARRDVISLAMKRARAPRRQWRAITLTATRL